MCITESAAVIGHMAKRKPAQLPKLPKVTRAPAARRQPLPLITTCGRRLRGPKRRTLLNKRLAGESRLTPRSRVVHVRTTPQKWIRLLAKPPRIQVRPRLKRARLNNTRGLGRPQKRTWPRTTHRRQGILDMRRRVRRLGPSTAPLPKPQMPRRLSTRG